MRPLEAHVTCAGKMTIAAASQSCHEAQMRRPVPRHMVHTQRATQPLPHPPCHGSCCVTGTPGLWGDSPRVRSWPCCHQLSLAGGAGRGPSSWPRGRGGVVCRGAGARLSCPRWPSTPGTVPRDLVDPLPGSSQPFSKPLPACALLATPAELSQPSPSSRSAWTRVLGGGRGGGVLSTGRAP